MSEKKKSSKDGFLIQGTILAVAGIITKIIGFVYRIPMLNIMGLQGEGYYEIAFQVYSMALLISSYSLPLAVSKLVSARIAKGQYRNAQQVFKAALLFAFSVGSVIMVVIFFGAGVIASIMGAKVSLYALRVLAPGLLVVAVMGVFRGYFQGCGTMIPTAISQILEQFLNAVVSIVGASMLMDYGLKMAQQQDNELLGPAYAAAGGTLGTVSGAVIGLLFLLFCYYASRKVICRRVNRDRSRRVESYSSIFKLMILTIAPVILSSAVYNMGNIIDSAMFNNIMAAQGHLENECVEILGKLGQYYNLFNVPLAVASALGSSMIPGLVRAYETREKRLLHNRIYMAIRFTMLITIPSAFGLCIVGRPILDFIWPSIDNTVQAMMFRIGAVSLVFYSLSTVTNAVLQGINRMMKPVKNATISLIIHVVSLFIMMVFFKWGIYGVIVSKIIFSLSMCILNAHDIREAIGYRQEKSKTFVIPCIASAIMGVVVYLVNMVLSMFISGRISILIALVVAVLVYGISLLKLGGLTEDEILEMPKGATLLSICKKFHLINDRFY